MIEEAEEALHYARVIEAFKTFAERSRRSLKYHFDDLNRLEEDELALIPEYRARLEELNDHVLEVNQVAFNTIIEAVVEESMLLTGKPDFTWPTDRDFENLRSLLRQMVRDWSAEGATEREACYNPIIQSLHEAFPCAEGVRVLLPGAGLGRLAYEMVQRGFSTQGNEFSWYMLLPSQFILNSSQPGILEICPFARPLCNQLSQKAAHRIISIPDRQLLPPPEGVDFSMTAGDFLEIYSKPDECGAWDSLVSCYFLDTAPNVLRYLRLFWSLLKPGGVWINHGPLQYHFEGSKTEMSIELIWEEIKLAAERIGFCFLKCEIGEPEKYASDCYSLKNTQYRPIHSVAIKPKLK